MANLTILKRVRSEAIRSEDSNLSCISSIYVDSTYVPGTVYNSSSMTVNPGGYLSILMDKTHLEVNSRALGKKVLSSVDIVGRLRHYITSVIIMESCSMECLKRVHIL